jgi:hypothetical protein
VESSKRTDETMSGQHRAAPDAGRAAAGAGERRTCA